MAILASTASPLARLLRGSKFTCTPYASLAPAWPVIQHFCDPAGRLEMNNFVLYAVGSAYALLNSAAQARPVGLDASRSHINQLAPGHDVACSKLHLAAWSVTRSIGQRQLRVDEVWHGPDEGSELNHAEATPSGQTSGGIHPQGFSGDQSSDTLNALSQEWGSWQGHVGAKQERTAPWEPAWGNSVAICAVMKQENVTDVREWLQYYRRAPLSSSVGKIWRSSGATTRLLLYAAH